MNINPILGLHPEDVKAAIRKRGSSLAEVARELNLSQQMISNALRYRSHRSARVEAAIAKAAGVSAEAIWPDRYPSSSHHRDAA